MEKFTFETGKPPPPVTDIELSRVNSLYSDARLVLVVHLPFFGHLLLRMKLVVTRKIPMAAVNQIRDLMINPDWALSTTKEEFRATIVHEMLHCAFLTFTRRNDRNVIVVDQLGQPMSLWNIAADFTINECIALMSDKESNDKSNTILLNPNLWDPKGVIDEKYYGWTTEAVYDDLLNKVQQNSKNQTVVMGIQYSGDQSDMKDEGEGEGEGSKEEQKQPSRGEVEQFWKVALAEAIQVHEQSKSRGTLPAGLKKMVEDILDPRISWVDVLSRWIGENGKRADFTYSRPSRRSQVVGELLPGLRKSGIADVAVLWDTSGSMYGREADILAEVLAICQDLDLTIRLLTCDTVVQTDYTISPGESLVEIGGGGGSDFTPAFALLEEDGFQGVIVAFTDGYISVPKVKPNHAQGTLWVIWEGDVDPTGGTWGDVLNVDKDGFKKKEKK